MFSKKNLKYQKIPLPDNISTSDEEMLFSISQFKEYMLKRHTIRDFSDREVSFDVIKNAIQVAGSAPSGANHQPWHFVAVSYADIKSRIREAAEIEEEKFYAGGGGDEWIKALEPIGTNAKKPHLEIAPWVIIIFAERHGLFEDGTKYKNYYVPESIGIATGFLIAALHKAGLSVLTHTPNPMNFLTKLCNRPLSNKPVMILTVGHASSNATVPKVAKMKKPIDQILTLMK